MARKVGSWVFVDATERDAESGVLLGDLCSLESDGSVWTYNGSTWDPAGGSGGGLGTLDTTDSPIWLCNLNGDLLDTSGNGNDLSEFAGSNTHQFVSAFGRQWLKCDGGTVLTAAADAAMDSLGDCTMVAVVKMNTPITDNRLIFGRQDAAGAGSAANSNYLLYFNSNDVTYLHHSGSKTINSKIMENPNVNNIGMGFHMVGMRRDVTANTITFCFDDDERVYTSGTYSSDPSDGASAPMMVAGTNLLSSILDHCLIGSLAVYDSDIGQSGWMDKYGQIFG